MPGEDARPRKPMSPKDELAEGRRLLRRQAQDVVDRSRNLRHVIGLKRALRQRRSDRRAA